MENKVTTMPPPSPHILRATASELQQSAEELDALIRLTTVTYNVEGEVESIVQEMLIKQARELARQAHLLNRQMREFFEEDIPF